MKVFFRVDASLDIGIGHVMRCLTLAEALKEKGAQVEFICREHEGNLIDFIQGKGFKVHTLSTIENDSEVPKTTSLEPENVLGHTHWLGATQQQDADECKIILKKISPDWLIVDHYAIDETWKMELQGAYQNLMVIDDLADRRHQCDLLLDQTYGRQPQDYQKLVPDNCQMLLGSHYALLRPEFAQWREYSLKRRETPGFKKLLITMGGVDQNNVTGQVLDELRNCDLPLDLEVTVIMGGTAPHLEVVQQQAQTLPYKIEVKSNVSNMAAIMANADFAIGASGATTWERCCLGLLSVQIVLADNQIKIAKELQSIHATKYLKDIKELPVCLESLMDEVYKTVLVASSLCDGCGVDRVAECIIASNEESLLPRLEPASLANCSFIHGLQTRESRKYFKNKNIPSKEEHISWFNKILTSKSSQIFIVTFNEDKVGMLRLDDLNNQVVEISIIISPLFSGKGFAKKALEVIKIMLPFKKLKAVIHNDNLASQKAFQALGFESDSQGIEFVNYYLPNSSKEGI